MCGLVVVVPGTRNGPLWLLLASRVAPRALYAFDPAPCESARSVVRYRTAPGLTPNDPRRKSATWRRCRPSIESGMPFAPACARCTCEVTGRAGDSSTQHPGTRCARSRAGAGARRRDDDL